MTDRLLGRKQSIRDLATWQAAAAASRDLWPDSRLDPLLDETVEKVKRTAAGKRVGYGWSGGKDSLALKIVMDLAGIDDCVLAISSLEFPAMLAWATDNMPPGLEIVNLGQDLTWLRDHPQMLFPHGRFGAHWFKIVNHAGQRAFFRSRRLDLIALGRRRADGNFCGPRGVDLYRNREGVVRWSPMADWPHEAVLSLLLREQIELPPCYSWPRGFQVGTGSWPARQWTTSREHGYEEVWEIDPDVVRQAAEHEIPGAGEFMAARGYT